LTVAEKLPRQAIERVEPDMPRFVVARGQAMRGIEREVEAPRRMPPPRDGIVGAGLEIRRLTDTIRRVGPASMPAIVQGPSGAGKELAARAPRAQGA
jgi:transcriptional regulator with AAA-type ATPase domain